ncbi:hypothetical protein TNCV_746901, partial [Trichonephila clavipes]
TVEDLSASSYVLFDKEFAGCSSENISYAMGSKDERLLSTYKDRLVTNQLLKRRAFRVQGSPKPFGRDWTQKAQDIHQNFGK